MKKNGFTLLELIVVISIITLLMGVLGPSFHAIKRQAKSLSQKAQLRDIEIGLEVWKTEHDSEYPDSFEEGAIKRTYGAHKLAEALVGRDLRGMDPSSTGDAEADESNPNIYDINSSREYNYIELDNIGVAQMSQITDTSNVGLTDAYMGDLLDDGTLGPNAKPAYVFTDVFHAKKIVNGSGKTVRIGSPILYYKANSETDRWDNTSNKQIFTFHDNIGLMTYGSIKDSTIDHPYLLDYNITTLSSTMFHEDLINPIYPPTAGNYVPYNRGSFLLLSAGNDGLYGTEDDIWNMSK